MRIEVASAAQAQKIIAQLNDLLIRTVDDGASIGWLPPMKAAAAEHYWADRIAAVGEGSCVLLLAWDGGTLVGSAQLHLEKRENGLHRAEVQKVMVHPDHRRQGVAGQLMQALETCAAEHHRSLLVLDTRQGDPSEALYVKVGYSRVGAIPEYVINPDGGLWPTVLYCKILR